MANEIPRVRHPLENFYDLFRNAKMNVYYWTEKTAAIKNKNRKIDIFLAITVPTSAITAWPLWRTEIGWI
jgi:hypothetical protein